MMDTTTRAHILKVFLPCLKAINLNLSKVVSTTTEGTLSLVGNNKGVVSLLQKRVEDFGINNNIIKLQCLIHQEALCTKVSSLMSVMNIMVKSVNFVMPRGLIHRQFRQLLLQTENLYGGLFYFCNIRWLSRGDILQRVYLFREEIATFIGNKYMNATKFCNQEWVSNLAFLVDLTLHSNSMNLQLQVKLQLIQELWSYVHTFETKFRF